MDEERALLRHYPSYFVFRAFCGLMRLLPAALVGGLFSAASQVAYLLDGAHRRLALSNLDIAFGDAKSAQEKRAIARGSFRSLFLTIGELILVPRLVRDLETAQKSTNFGGIARALRKNRGVIFLISHFGNWELMAHCCVAGGHRLISVGRPIRNPLIYREIERLRCWNGAEMLRKKWVARDVIESLRSNSCVAMLIDQYAGRNAPFVPFFGRPVSTTPAIALLAMKTGAVVLPVFNIRERFCRNHLYVCEPVEIADTGNLESEVPENCARFNRVLEEWIRRRPDHWLWMARRWRRKKGPDEP